MADIDFLPIEYRRQRRSGEGAGRRVATVAVVVVAAAASAVWQHRRLEPIRAELAQLEPSRQLVEGYQAELARLNERLAVARADAELVTYLRHPWPRTQMLDAILADMPQQFVLQELKIAIADAPAATPPAATAAAVAPAAPTASAAELAMLRQAFDHKTAVVTMIGTASDIAAVYTWLGQLGQKPLVARASLGSSEVEQAQGEAGSTPKRVRFEARAEIRPGYGQPGGPTGLLANKPEPRAAEASTSARPQGAGA